MRKILLFIPLLLLSACSDNNDHLDQDTLQKDKQIYLERDLNYQSKIDFGKALVKVLAESKEARDLVKKESLEKINCDYDVLYSLIKDHQLENGKTLEDLLTEHMDKPKLRHIEELIPTLTIFVPELPLESFSAEIWNTNTDVPVVSIKTNATSDILMLPAEGNEYYIKPEMIPTYPVVVIKENESIIYEPSPQSKRVSSRASLHTSINTTNFKFIDKSFDNTKGKNAKISSAATRSSSNNGLELADKKVLDSYNLTKEKNQAWQRDYIYYNIIETEDKGRIDKNYSEHLISIQPINARVFYNTLNNQDNIGYDVRKSPGGSRGESARWQDGNFEFVVKVLALNKSGVSTEIEKIFPLYPNNLFIFKYETIGKGANGRGGYLVFKDIISAEWFLPEPLELFQWNLDEKSTMVKISLEELDPTTTVKQSNSTTTKFASNFSFEASWGEKVKKGAKFGGSIEETHVVGYEYTVQEGNDKLGSFEMYFGDDVINGDALHYFTSYRDATDNPVIKRGPTGKYRLDNYRKYNLGNCKLIIAPRMYAK